MKFSCFLVILLFLAPYVIGQELYGKFLDHEQGLLSQECYDLNHDEKGYLIVGTQYGPMKYDGEKFIPICTNLPIERRVMCDFEKAPETKFLRQITSYVPASLFYQPAGCHFVGQRWFGLHRAENKPF